MSPPPSRAPRLDDLVALLKQLREDQAADLRELRRRDREIGRALPAASASRSERILAWLAALGHAGEHDAGRAQRLGSLVLFAAGAIAGLGAARAVLGYDGRYPVNVIEVLAVFVGLQLLLLAATGVLALPAAARRRVPGLAGLADALSVLSPGRWQAPLRRLLPPAGREALDLAVGRGRAHRRLLGGVHRWAVLLWSQVFATAFNLGAIATCLFLVLFTDLAFGWSTTLTVDGAGFHRLVDSLALPWAAWLPEARPSLELVEATRYFRLGDAGPADALRADVGPELPGRWWGFVVACIACYGLAPRAGLWLLTRGRLRAAIAQAFEHVPGVPDLCDRLEQPLVETTAREPEADAPRPDVSAPGTGECAPSGRAALVVNWAGVALDETAAAELVERATGARAIAVHAAGGAATVAADSALLERLGATAAAEPVTVTVLVRAWEPPVLEFVDFATDLRTALGDALPVVVLAVTLGDHGPAATPADDLDRWRRRLAAAGDPWLTVRAALPQETPS